MMKKKAIYARWMDSVTPWHRPQLLYRVHVMSADFRSGLSIGIPGIGSVSIDYERSSVLAAAEKGLFSAREDVGPWATVDISDQPTDDDPYLRLAGVDPAEAELLIERFEMAAVEGALGLDRKQAGLIDDLVGLLKEVATAAGATPILSARIDVLAGRAEREHAEVQIAEALVARHKLRELKWDDTDYHWPTQHSDLVPRVDELAGWLDRTTLREAELAVRQANPLLSLKAYEKKYPGKLAASHHSRFRAALKTWLEVYIPRTDFAEVTGFGKRGRPWTDAALKRSAAELATRVRAEAEAEQAAEGEASEGQ